MGKEQNVSYYDEVYSRSDSYYDLDYSSCPHFPIIQTVGDYLKTTLNHKILEIGCGTGQLAHYLYDLGYKDYNGFDASIVAVEKAKARCKQNFYVGNAFNSMSYEHDYNVAIATEILEHLEDDIAVIKHIKPGAEFIASFPTFTDPAHVRLFKKPMDILNRYSEYVNFNRINHVDKWFVTRGVIIG